MQECRGVYSLFNAECSLMRVCMSLYVCSKSSLKQLGQLKPNFVWNHNGIGRGKFIQMIPVICCSSFEHWPLLGGGGAFCRAFTTNVAPQCRAFSRALEIEKLKAPLFLGPEGSGDTKDWCITALMICA